MVQQDHEHESATERGGGSGTVDRIRDLPLLKGTMFGALAFLVGYVLTLLLTRVAGGLVGSQEPIELAGLVFYGAHFVSGTIDWPTGVQPVNALGEISSTIPTFVYYLVPVVLLTGASYLLVNRLARRDTLTPGGGSRAGMSIVLGYLPLVVLGALLFGINVYTATPFGSAIWQADLLSAVVLAGLVYPLAFGALGGYLAVSYPSERFGKQRLSEDTDSLTSGKSLTIDSFSKNPDQ